jgi:phosphoenolpyruvate carboxykinase (ATP)
LAAARLVELFVENFAQFADAVDEGVLQAAPKLVKGQARQSAQVNRAQTTSA